MGWLKVNGCDFNLNVAALSFEDFKKEFQGSFCRNRSDEEIKSVWLQLRQAAGIVEPVDEQTEKDVAFEPLPTITSNGITSGNKKKSSKPAGQRNGIGY